MNRKKIKAEALLKSALMLECVLGEGWRGSNEWPEKDQDAFADEVHAIADRLRERAEALT